jgi:FkbM family methyltransferase
MLVNKDEMYNLFKLLGIQVRGALHVGAHECEEQDLYDRFGLKRSEVIWIDALQEKVEECIKRGFPNVYQAVITDHSDDSVVFHVTNNAQSSSILEFGTHAHHHPHVVETGTRTLRTTTLSDFFRTRGLNPESCSFWNLDIQGAELLALKGAESLLHHANAIYSEVNTEEVYKGCAKLDEMDAFLGRHGFVRVLTAMTPYGWGDALWIRPVYRFISC